MKAKRLFLAIAALLAVGGLWLAGSAWRTHEPHKSSMDVGLETPTGQAKPGQMLQSPEQQPRPGQMLRPPDPIRRFRDLTPEQRVKLARQGPIGG